MLKHAFVKVGSINSQQNSCLSLLGLGQLFAGHSHEIGEIFMVVNVGDVKIVLRTWVGWEEFNSFQHAAACLGRLDE